MERNPSQDLTKLQPLLLRLADTLLDQILPIFMRHGVSLSELKNRLDKKSVAIALQDHEFAIEGREAHRQTVSHAAAYTGLSRRTVQEFSVQDADDWENVHDDIHLILRTADLWQTQAGFQDDAGLPVNLTLRGSGHTLDALTADIRRDVPVRALADLLVKFEIAVWQNKQLAWNGPVAKNHPLSEEQIVILGQIASDFLHTLKMSLDPNRAYTPRTREAYFCDIASDSIEAAAHELHELQQDFNSQCETVLRKYRANSKQLSVRYGIGTYTFYDAPIHSPITLKHPSRH